MAIDTIYEDQRWKELDLQALAEQATDVALAVLDLEPEHFEICLLGCDDARIALLNADFRGKPTPTNVLSWPTEERAATSPGTPPHLPESDGSALPTELGDIAIAFETCTRESEDVGKPISDHITHLIVHGVLHLLGYDHINDKDAALMEGLEVKILGKLGLSNPYVI